MTNVKCEIEVTKVTTTEEPKKDDLVSVILSGLIMLRPPDENSNLTDEFVPVKITIKGVKQRELLELNGIGKKGDKKTLELQDDAQIKFGE